MLQWKNNSKTFIKVEWQGAQNEPGVDLPERHFIHGCLASKKEQQTDVYTGFYTGINPTNDVG